ncbi:MAG: glucosyl transferase family 2, partial [Akkermansiaceae bacterium]|nr:glucosyl transferase family 2 [Akkermansiaceae bacterium]
EINVPEVMLLADAAVGSIDPALDPSAPGRHGVVAAVVDPYLNGVHVSLLDPGELSDAEEALAERCLAGGPAAMAKPEMTELMYSAQAMLFMHRGVWLRPADTIHSVWTTAVESYRHRLDGTEMV